MAFGSFTFQGYWDADTNSPFLISGRGTDGHVYEVSVSGSTTLDGISTWTDGDLVIFVADHWVRFTGNALAAASLLDEDSMASNSATQPASQQSIKAYTDAVAATTLAAAQAADAALLIDEDDMATDSAARAPTQQSVKAYIGTRHYKEIFIDDYATINLAIAAMTENSVLVGRAGTTYTPDDGDLTIGVLNFGIRSTIPGVRFTIDFSGNTTFHNDGLLKMIGALDDTLVNVSINSPVGKSDLVEVTSASYSSPTVTMNTRQNHGLVTGDLAFVYSSASFGTQNQEAYLTMKTSNEGMTLAVPVEITRTSDTQFTYTPLYNGTPGASLTENIGQIWVRKNDLWLDLASTSGFAIGDMLLISSSDNHPSYTGGVTLAQGEHNEVRAIEGGGLWLKYPVKFSYNTTPVVSLVSDVVTCGIKDLKIIGKGDSPSSSPDAADIGFRLRYARHCSIDIEIADCDNMAMQYINCLDCEIPLTRITFDRTNEAGASSGFIHYQYGVGVMNACRNLHFGSVYVNGGRHGIDETCLSAFGPGRAIDITFDHSVCENQWSHSIDSHDHAEDWVFNYVRIKNSAGFGWRSRGLTIKELHLEDCSFGFNAYGDLRDYDIDIHTAKNVGYAGIRMYCSSSSWPSPDNLSFRVRQLSGAQFGIRMDVHDNHIVTRLRIHELNCKKIYYYPLNLRDYSGSNTGFEYRGVYVGRINADTTGTLFVGKNCSEGIFENFFAVDARSGSSFATFTGTNDNNLFRNFVGALAGGGAIGTITISGTGNRANGIVKSQTLVMASNAATISWIDVPFVYIDTSGGAAEDLNTLSGGDTGFPMYFRAFNPGSRVPTLKDGVDNIQCGSDIALNNSRLWVPMIYTGSEWNSIGTPAAA